MDIFEVSVYFVSLFLTICLEVRWQSLILRTIQVSIFPITFGYLCWPITNILPIHFLQSIEKISGLGKGYKTIPTSFASSLISYNSSHIK